MAPSTKDIERFKAFICPEPNSGCLLWMGGTNGNGLYGRFHYQGHKIEAHRFALEIKLGRPVKDTRDAHHKCGVTLCVNGDHLAEVTPQANQRYRRRRKCAKHKCFLRRYAGRRLCRVCKNEYQRGWRLRRAKREVK